MHYRNAPVAEAIIDLNFTFEEQPSLASLEGMARDLKSQFPIQQRIDQLQMAFGPDTVGKGSLPGARREHFGVRLTTERNDRVLQLRRTGLTYSHLPPYSRWETFHGEARQYLDGYVGSFRPTMVVRTAVRYINHIAASQGGGVDEYLKLGPVVPELFGPTFNGYFMQVQVPVPEVDANCSAIVNTGVQEGSGDSLGLLLDIDVFTTSNVSPHGDETARLLGRLREAKNKLFEACITDRVREAIS